jgi:hypothetical protein
MPVNDLALFEQIIVLVGHLAWPVTTIILLLLIRRPISTVSAALAERIRDPQSSLSASYGDAKIGIVGGASLNESGRLYDKLKSDPELEKRLIEWLKRENPDLTPTDLLFSADNEELLKKAVGEIAW